MRKRSKQCNQASNPNFDAVPIPVLCQSINMIMENMANRGFPVRDFDHKDKVVKRVGMIGGKAYFLSTKEDNHAETT
ncbi:MAG: hypothetical protein IJV71_03515 [Lachnospiraceae bacterium]|nr:hypothetical protein [Lachnospiraceae bacterium]